MKDPRSRRLMYKIKRVIDISKLRYQLVPLCAKRYEKLEQLKHEFNLFSIDEIYTHLLKMIKIEDEKKLKYLLNITTRSISMIDNLSIFTKQGSNDLH